MNLEKERGEPLTQRAVPLKPKRKAPSFHQVTSRGMIGNPGEELLSRLRLNTKQTDPKSQHPVSHTTEGAIGLTGAAEEAEG